MRARIRIGTLAALVGITSAVVGCNAVLGIDQAELDEGSSTAGKPGVAAGKGSFVSMPTDDCSACMQANCTPPLQACLADATCRAKLTYYDSTCITLANADPGTCREGLSVPGLSTGVANCLTANCASQCGASPLVDACDLYCNCMGAAGGCGTSIAECSANCTAWRVRPGMLDCVLSHCEAAVESTTPANHDMHCSHARRAQNQDK
ncbi:MAG TPA: hypothetical protein VGQ57_05110, partial [Polyangiaceae bacterium]|nr:hypothetical protein [Polyangiaceae bacterium]